MSSKIYVGGLPYATTDAQLQDLFSTHGQVESARVITDKFTGRSRGFGFVEMVLVIVAVKDEVVAAVVAAVTAGSSQHIRIDGALGRGAPFFCQSLSRIASERFTLTTSMNEYEGGRMK